ncbi:AAA family ATPase [Candidatus Woesearchaeota archaeon]|nr:AAA family ATPase [Candidatus Woesearchaeota archaeon]
MSSDKLSDVVYGYTANANSLEEQNHLLKEHVGKLRGEIERYKKSPLMICEILNTTPNNAVIKIPNGNQFYVEISTECEKLKPGDTVLVEQRNLVIVGKLNTQKNYNVDKFVIVEKPEISWKEIGGLRKQIEQIREVIELPLTKPEMFKKTGIQPPKGVLLYGQPGTGKTLVAKAVAAATNSTFIEIVASELVQKYIGEGAKLVSEIFQMAREKAPSIVFIDEIDALAAKRIDIGTSGEREVQRTFMQLLAEIDGFDSLGDVKIIASTNRKDILDPAILRPGRLERHIYFDLPTAEGKAEIFKIHTRKMTLKNVETPKIISQMEEFTGAEVRAACTEAGYYAIRNSRIHVTTEDFIKGVQRIKEREKEDQEYLTMFG